MVFYILRHNKYNEKKNLWGHVCKSLSTTKRSHQQRAMKWTFAYIYPVEPNVCGAASVTDWVLGESMGDDYPSIKVQDEGKRNWWLLTVLLLCGLALFHILKFARHSKEMMGRLGHCLQLASKLKLSRMVCTCRFTQHVRWLDPIPWQHEGPLSWVLIKKSAIWLQHVATEPWLVGAVHANLMKIWLCSPLCSWGAVANVAVICCAKFDAKCLKLML